MISGRNIIPKHRSRKNPRDETTLCVPRASVSAIIGTHGSARPHILLPSLFTRVNVIAWRILGTDHAPRGCSESAAPQQPTPHHDRHNTIVPTTVVIESPLVNINSQDKQYTDSSCLFSYQFIKCDTHSGSPTTGINAIQKDSSSRGR